MEITPDGRVTLLPTVAEACALLFDVETVALTPSSEPPVPAMALDVADLPLVGRLTFADTVTLPVAPLASLMVVEYSTAAVTCGPTVVSATAAPIPIFADTAMPSAEELAFG